MYRIFSIGLLLLLVACSGGRSIDQPTPPNPGTEYDFETRTDFVNVVSGATFAGQTTSLNLTYDPPNAEEDYIVAGISLGRSERTDLMNWRGEDPSIVLFGLRDGLDNEKLVTTTSQSVALDSYEFFLVGVGQLDSALIAPKLEVLTRLDVDARIKVRLMHAVVDAQSTSVDIYDGDAKALIASGLNYGDISPAYVLVAGRDFLSLVVTASGELPDYDNAANNLYTDQVNSLGLGAHFLFLYDTAAGWAQTGQFYENPFIP